MKHTLLTLLLALILSGTLVAQNRGFSFQSYAVDFDGRPLDTHQIDVRFTVYEEGQSPAYTEDHITTTDPFGVFSLEVGAKNLTNFNALDFAGKYYKLKVDVKSRTAADYKTVSDNWLSTVPYAKAAQTAETANNGVPVGTVIAWAGPLANIPSGWLLCDGGTYSTTLYPALYAAIGFSWGGSGSNFRVPDLRGQFLRGVSGTSGQDPDAASRTTLYSGGNAGNNVGSFQGHQFASHSHGVSDPGHSHGIDDWRVLISGTGPNEGKRGGNYEGGNVGESTDHRYTGVSINNSGGNETRPRNANVFFIIKL